MKNTKINRLAFIIIIGFLASCGGGGDSEPEPPPPPPVGSSDWDSMVWDQDDWG